MGMNKNYFRRMFFVRSTCFLGSFLPLVHTRFFPPYPPGYPASIVFIVLMRPHYPLVTGFGILDTQLALQRLARRLSSLPAKQPRSDSLSPTRWAPENNQRREFLARWALG